MSEGIPTMNLADSPTGCCPRFDPAPWDGKEFSFEGLKFVTASTRSFFYMPTNMAKVMEATQKAIADAGAAPKDRYLMLSKDLSPWRAEHRFLVSKDVPGMKTDSIRGRFLAKVFEGPYNQMGAWYKAMASLARDKGAEASEILAFYTTCPSCAKAYGKNYVVLFAKVGAKK